MLWPGAPDGEALAAAVRRMTSAQAHRGPDDEGFWFDAAAGMGLGFRRLAILDLSALGHQPMQSQDARFSMVFNGEVYNYRELRRDLEPLGWSFRGGSDTEVILAAFQQWGVEGAVQRFIGMFAIALWDRSQRRLHLIRDRIGIKPLHVYRGPGLMAFASELKAFMHVPGFTREIDGAALGEYLRYLYVPAPRTIFRNVSKLLPGHILTVDEDGAEHARPYWSAEDVAAAGIAARFEGTDAEGIAEVERVLTDAARLRLRSDVPLGAFLSGGIDSTTVVALMQSASPRPVRTFSIGFDAVEHDESAHARSVAEALGTDHTEIHLTGDHALDMLPRMSTVFDEPFADASQLPTLLICEAARRAGLVVAVSGDGGDEVFAGYNRYVYGERMLPPALRVPRAARRLIASGLMSVSPSVVDRVHAAVSSTFTSGGARHRLVGEKVTKIGTFLPHEDFAGMYRSLMSAWQHPDRLTGIDGNSDRLIASVRGTGSYAPLDRMMLADQLMYLPDDLLAKVDRASMAVSLEVRVPLLDHRAVELSWSLPRRFKVRDGESKWVLRRIAERHVPATIIRRPKVGFTVPLDQWLRGPLRGWAEDLLTADRLGRNGVLRPEPIRRAWRDFNAGRGRWSSALWAVLMLQAWREEWLT